MVVHAVEAVSPSPVTPDAALGPGVCASTLGVPKLRVLRDGPGT